MESLPRARLQQPLYVLQASEVAGFVYCGPEMLIQLPKWSAHISEQHFVCSENTWNYQVNIHIQSSFVVSGISVCCCSDLSVTYEVHTKDC